MPPMPTVDPIPLEQHAAAENGNGRIFAPPESFAWRAISWNRWLVIGCAIAFCAAGIAYGALRAPVYTSSATLQVGDVNPNSPGFLGYVQSATSLATAFSRAITAGPVLAAVEKEMNLPAANAAARLSSEPISLSPAFRVIATGPTAHGAQELANTAAHAIVGYEATTNSANPQAKSLLEEFQAAALTMHRSKHQVAALESESVTGRQLLEAEADRSAAKVKLQAIENAYVAAVTSQAPRQGLVTVLAGATSSEDDRKSKMRPLRPARTHRWPVGRLRRRVHPRAPPDGEAADRMSLPNLFVIGAAKAGTTSLHYYLDQHPEIQMSAVKEPNFFSGPPGGNGYPLGRVETLADYESLFDDDFPLRGEASVGYSNFPRRQGVPGAIKVMVPEARFVYLVRDPVARVVSQYQYRVAMEGEQRPLAEALADLDDPYSVYLCPGRYALQLELYLEEFDREQILVVDHADLLADRAAVLKSIFAFLGARPTPHLDAFQRKLNTEDEKRAFSTGWVQTRSG